MQRTISALELARDLELRDLTDPSAGPHAIQDLVASAARALSSRWSCAARCHRGERAVTLEENYDGLGFLPDVVTRDARYTRYVSEDRVLRSHTSAIVPGALRALAAEAAGGIAPSDVLLVCPGLCYRRDSIDRLHTGTPHQMDLWRVARTPLGNPDLDEMIDTLCTTLVPGRRYRCEARVHPYTLDGRQVDIEWEGSWVEIAECGLAHPGVLARCGLDPAWTGLALGMGLDRLLMLVKGIDDIRLLRSTDGRVVSQMLDLEPYRPVSAMPAIRRDLSVAVADDDEVEDLGDRVREALGDEADAVEEVVVLSATPWRDLPEPARERLGISAGQHNVLVRVSLRALDRTLSDEEANELRDRIYAALHRGSVHSWASPGRTAGGGA